MTSQESEFGDVVIERIDRYSIAVDGYVVRANEQQERAVRNMTSSQRADFLHVMGVVTTPEGSGA